MEVNGQKKRWSHCRREEASKRGGGEHMDGDKETKVEEAECQCHQIELAHVKAIQHAPALSPCK